MVMRNARRLSATGFHHVVTRGNNKQLIFEDDCDRLKFLGLLDGARCEFGIRIIAWCLMDNHVHLCLDDFEGHLSEFMHRILSRFASYMNYRHGREGHLFQGRYFSDPIESDERLLECVRYILNNPAYAGICSARDYRWSCYSEYATEARIVDTSPVLEMLGGPQPYESFIADSDRCLYAFEGGRYLPDDDAKRLACTVADRFDARLDEVKALCVSKRNEVLRAMIAHGLSYQQIGRLCGVSTSTVGRAAVGT